MLTNLRNARSKSSSKNYRSQLPILRHDARYSRRCHGRRIHSSPVQGPRGGDCKWECLIQCPFGSFARNRKPNSISIQRRFQALGLVDQARVASTISHESAEHCPKDGLVPFSVVAAVSAHSGPFSQGNPFHHPKKRIVPTESYTPVHASEHHQELAC